MKALGFLASDDERLGRFMALTGLGPKEIRAGASDPSFLVGVLDHLRGDESLLLIFAESENLDPAAIGEAAMLLGSPQTP